MKTIRIIRSRTVKWYDGTTTEESRTYVMNNRLINILIVGLVLTGIAALVALLT